MIKSVTVTNHLGESVTMELRNPERSGFLILPGTDGLGPPKADINTTEVLAKDGSVFNSARAVKRNIVLCLGFLDFPTIEHTRQRSYKYFPIKKRIKVSIETDNRTTETYGYVESNEPDIFSEQEGATISILCPESYLVTKDKQITIFSTIEPLFEFPFSNESTSEKLIEFGNLQYSTKKSITYEGDSSTGMIIYVHALGSVVNLKIANERTQELMSINHNKLVALLGSGISEGDDIIISTVIGDKYILLQRDGISHNILNCLDRHPNWFQLEKGDNIFYYAADSGATNLQFRIENQIAYEGI